MVLKLKVIVLSRVYPEFVIEYKFAQVLLTNTAIYEPNFDIYFKKPYVFVYGIIFYVIV